MTTIIECRNFLEKRFGIVQSMFSICYVSGIGNYTYKLFGVWHGIIFFPRVIYFGSKNDESELKQILRIRSKIATSSSDIVSKKLPNNISNQTTYLVKKQILIKFNWLVTDLNWYTNTFRNIIMHNKHTFDKGSWLNAEVLIDTIMLT